MAESHTAKGKSVGVLGGAIEHTEVAKFEEVYIRHRWYYRHEISRAYVSPPEEQICNRDPLLIMLLISGRGLNVEISHNVSPPWNFSRSAQYSLHIFSRAIPKRLCDVFLKTCTSKLLEANEL